MRILIVRLGALGDLVHTLPAVTAIRRAHPAAVIDWIVDARHATFLQQVPVISSCVVMQKSTVGAWVGALRTLRGRRYDIALDFQGLIKSAALARLSGAQRSVGFARDALREPAAALLYTSTIDVGTNGHVIRKNLRLAETIAPHALSAPLEFPIARVPSAAIENLVAPASPFAVINPGAAWPNKRWGLEAFAAVAEHLDRQHGLKSVILWGPGERPAAESIVAASGSSAHVAPPTNLAEVIELSRGARILISGDTGPLHLAAAVGTPVVALFGPTDPDRNGPWDARDIAVARYDRCVCHYKRQCRHADPREWCLHSISVAEVTAAIDRRLAR
jgi:heptosyltransferase-1